MANHRTRAIPEPSADEREGLERWVLRQKTLQALALHTRIVLAGADGESDIAVAERLDTTRVTVGGLSRPGAMACLTGPGPVRRAGSGTRT